MLSVNYLNSKLVMISTIISEVGICGLFLIPLYPAIQYFLVFLVLVLLFFGVDDRVCFDDPLAQ